MGETKTNNNVVYRSTYHVVWTNSYFVATVGGAPLKTVKEYVENQRGV